MPDHYKLHAYVGPPGMVQTPAFEGWATAEQILQQRPDGCRYAVVEPAHLPRNAEGTMLWRFEAWDLLDSDFIQRAGRAFAVLNGHKHDFPTPPVVDTGTSLDGLIMKTLALYDREPRP